MDTADNSELYSQNITLIKKAREGDEEATALLLENNAGLVRSIAVRFRDRGTEFEDLIQIGTLGMLKAIRSFDTGRGTAFSTYAVPLIVGEIRRHLRDDGMLKISRGYKKLGMQLSRERNRIISEEGREPRIGELAEKCSVTVEEAAVALDAMTPVSSLSDTLYGDDGVTLEGRIASDDNEIERMSDSIALSQSIAKCRRCGAR